MEFTLTDIKDLIHRVITENEKVEDIKLLEGFASYYESRGGAGNSSQLILDVFVNFLSENPSSMLFPNFLGVLLQKEVKQSSK